MESCIRAVAYAVQEVADRGAPTEIGASAEALRRVAGQERRKDRRQEHNDDDAKAEPIIAVTDKLDPADLAVITDGLNAYDLGQIGYRDFSRLAVVVRDPQTGKVVGGLYGRSEFGLAYVDWLFLPENMRRARIGSRVLAMAEEEARRHGCTRIALTTLSVEAPGFYKKQGYDVAATIDCEPPGVTRHYMLKKL